MLIVQQVLQSTINGCLKERAKTLAGELVKMGVESSKISQVGKGGVDTLTPISFNRRATVQVTD